MIRRRSAAACAFACLCILTGAICTAQASADQVNLRLESFALNLTPTTISDTESRRVATLLNAGLIAVDQDGTRRPMIARSWEHDGSTWKFDIRDSLTFSNGADIRPIDIQASLCRSMQPSSAWAWALSSIEHGIDEQTGAVDCIGIRIEEQSVLITESTAAPWLLDALGGPAGWIVPAEADHVVEYGLLPGAGPYQVTSISPDFEIVLEPRATGSAIAAGVDRVVFRYLPDESAAVVAFRNQRLSTLHLSTPNLIRLLTSKMNGDLKLDVPGSLDVRPIDRVRVLIINEEALQAKGLSEADIQTFIAAYDRSIDRERIAAISADVGQPEEFTFPIYSDVLRELPPQQMIESLPGARLTIITESDPFSDLVAANLPTRLSNIRVDYRGVDKGVLIQSLVDKRFEMASVVVEATVHSPKFWAGFFTEGSAYTAFGKPLANFEGYELTEEEGIRAAARQMASEGNWISIIRERRIQAVAPSTQGLRYTPSGQSSYEAIRIVEP